MPKGSVRGVLWDANDEFNPAEACGWDFEKIIAFGQSVYDSPEKFGIGITDGPDDIAFKNYLNHSWPVVKKTLEWRWVFCAGDPAKGSPGWMFVGWDKIQLPVCTVYDFYAWLLSIAIVPRAAANSRNFYLPLLVCFGNWCFKIAENTSGLWMHSPFMVSIVRYHSLVEPIVPRAFLGVTMPDSKAFEEDRDRTQYVHAMRQNDIYRYTSLVPNPRNPDNNQPFGRCAETFFWMFAKNPSVCNLEKSVYGVALQIREGEYSLIPVDEYQMGRELNALRDPCRKSCQYLAAQVKSSWAGDGWRESFDINLAIDRQW
ncbi:hypothetical protein P152DRAFT_461454 [Eremomyces bilateralis CBS 781.70]|uniref:Uncharacterized protein n=1 Tax=Eremomyces bilateralis CBS 781.70 TaxID=1392243 RepID=A0A6G1FUM3_9PEZI|nr:uncharacterized protein P152DRAFT_461454 [Eremomyces bilateralis CBS 781.70]KAF1809507.1 hypothetical protein P152DRAFT_461454 [Eremomyces bilateralis CBS 781.70]